MHHFLKFYGTNQELVIKFYIWGAKFSRLPFIGSIFKKSMDWYAETQHKALILTKEETKNLIGAATSIAVGECKCRKVFGNCDAPIRADIVFGVGYDVFGQVSEGEYSEISKEEAMDIIDECSRMGLIQCVLKCRDEVYAICNCCPCCCVPLRLSREYGIKGVWVRDKNLVDCLLK